MVPVAPQHHRPTCDRDLTLAFALLGKRWNGIILGTLTAGPAGFADIARAIPGLSDSMLADRLRELTALGIVGRTVCSGPPITVAYQLTLAGQALVPVLRDMAAWAHHYLNADTGTPATTEHSTECPAGEHHQPDPGGRLGQGA
jgi:DNA-binding HxlR family transcriptional regulator